MTSEEIADAARRIGREVAGPVADDVHHEGRHPSEAITALREARLLGAIVPVELGGAGASITDMVQATRLLAQHCANAAMVFAMHQIQLALVVHHGTTPGLRAFLRDVAREQLLIASAASEVGIGGDARRSLCAIEQTADGYTLEKHASALSYGASADAIIATARRAAEAPEGEQVVVLARRGQFELEPTGPWDAMGLRGTDSRSFLVRAHGPADHVFPQPASDVLGRTGVAVNNLLQCSVWVGLAEGAMARAHAAMRAKVRKNPQAPAPAAMRLAELAAPLEQLRDTITSGARRAETVLAGTAEPDPRFVVAMNTLKVSASSLALDVVSRAMLITGIDAYRGGSPHSLGRHLADAYGAAIMVSNDRLLLSTGELLKVLKEL